jgi:hypothetical protein
MAEMGWTARMATAAGTAAGTGAAQLGLGYGLGVVVWPVVTTTDDSDWLGSLGWATWITASATVFGAVIASRLGGGPADRPRGPWRLGLAISAGVGALVAVALIALPARDAVRSDAVSPQVIAGGYALVGVLLGVLVAYWAVRSRPVAANLIFTAAWLWALAITAIVVELTTDRPSATYLTSLQFSEATAGGRYGTIYWPSALLTIAAAFVIGILAAIPAARRGELTLGTATSGAVGPLLVAASFLMLAPRLTGALGQLESAYLIAPYAVLAGLAGSAITVATAQSQAARRARKSAGDVEADTTAPIPEINAPTPTGRAKLPAQPTPDRPTPESTPASATPRSAIRSGDPGSGPGETRPAGTSPASPAGTAGSVPRPAPVPPNRGVTPPPPQGTAFGPAPGRATTPGAGSSPNPASPSSTSDDLADAEIAAAARPARGRAKKATPPPNAEDAKEPKSTVTPPPTTPTIAQINPRPTEAD